MEQCGLIEFYINEFQLIYPLRNDDLYSLRLKCADTILFASAEMDDGTYIDIGQYVQRGLDYECTDVILVSVNEINPRLSVTKVTTK